jgi:two-component system OmpR family response regulator
MVRRSPLGGLEHKSATDKPPRILVAPFEPMSAALAEYLQRHGYQVTSAPVLGASGGALLPAHDLLIASAAALIGSNALPGASADAPGVIALYRRSERELGLQALELGADDIFPGEGGERELLARVRAVLRRRARAQRGPVRQRTLWSCGQYVVDGSRRRVRLPSGVAIDLSSREFDLFRALAGRAGVVVSREELLQDVMGEDSDAFDRAVDCIISRLRKKLTTGPWPDPIITHPGVGYSFAEHAGAAT